MAERTGLVRVHDHADMAQARAQAPHLTDGFKISADPLFTEKVGDVAGLYQNPPEKAVVL